MHPGSKASLAGLNWIRLRTAATVLLIAGCTTVSQAPTENQTEPIELRFLYPTGSTANVESRTTVQSIWPQFSEALNETIHEKSRLRFEPVTDGNANQGSWVSFANQQLDYTSSFAPPVPFADLLRGMQFQFALTSSGASQEFSPLHFAKNSLLAAKGQNPTELHRRFAKETAWPAWLAALNGRSLVPGRAIQFEVVDYPVGCLGPFATIRDAELRITNTVTCPDHITTQAAQKADTQQCINLSFALNTSKENIIKNMKDALGPGDHDDILSSLMFKETNCIDSITALVNPRTMRVYESNYESRVDISAVNSTFKDGIQTITSKHLSKSTRYDWHDSP